MSKRKKKSTQEMTPILKTSLRLLTFRATEKELTSFGFGHLIFGLLWTWMVGMGRWWDDPSANVLQHLGVGSLVYVLMLALLLYLVLKPLRPKTMTYRQILTFVCLTSPPGILYAIPVELFMSVDDARSMNLGFLALVAFWRVALLFFFLRRAAGLTFLEVLCCALMPITGIICALSFLNFERALINVMAGLERRGNANDDFYEIVLLISAVSVYVFPVLLGIWIYKIVCVRREAKSKVEEAAQNQ